MATQIALGGGGSGGARLLGEDASEVGRELDESVVVARSLTRQLRAR
jgi:hypothetical protein